MQIVALLIQLVIVVGFFFGIDYLVNQALLIALQDSSLATRQLISCIYWCVSIIARIIQVPHRSLN